MLDHVTATIPNAFKVLKNKEKAFSSCFRTIRVLYQTFLFLDSAFIRSDFSRGDILLHCIYLKEFIRLHRSLCLRRASCVCHTGK